MPQPPQSFGSLVVSTHERLQSSRPAPHVAVHWPRLQTLFAHAFPQAPQLAGSLCTSTQRKLQGVSFPGQTHAPPMHVWPLGHAFPHQPQLSGSVSGSKQLRPQSIWPNPHGPPVHLPLEHTCPRVHTVLQPPQWYGSVLGFAQSPSQSTSPPGQTQTPFRQVSPF
jgi:hypothetical protein